VRGRRFRTLVYADSPNLRRPAKSRRRDRPHSPSNRPDYEDRRCRPMASFSFSARMTSEKFRGTPLASRADQSKHPDEPLRLKEIQNNGTRETGERKRA